MQSGCLLVVENVQEALGKRSLPLALCGGLTLLLYLDSFIKLAKDWYQDPNYSHGFLIPVMFGYLLWERHQRLGAAPFCPSSWGLVAILFAMAMLFAGKLGAEYFLLHSSLLVFLSGVVIFLFGFPAFRILSFPLGILVFMIPLPAIIFYSITLPLQLLASRLATWVLDLANVPNLREGNVLVLPHFQAGVVEACSGIRSLISLLAVAVFLSYFRRMPWTAASLLVAAAVPIALATNALRVAGTGLLGNYWGGQWAEGFFHLFSGWFLFLLATLSLGGASWVLSGFPWRPRTAGGNNR